jgi:DNA repair exonuclease SbcCD ATPase subunit
MITLQTDITEVDKIFHLADVHIRNHIRHKEYDHVFKKLEQYIKVNRTQNSIIYVAGDIVHSKSDISPELVTMVSRFIHGLSSLCPTLLILGNHDLNLKNPNRLNSIKPIVDLLKQNRSINKNLYLLDENEYYKFAQIGISVMEVSTLPENYKLSEELDTPVKIAFHHGAVHSANTTLDFTIDNKEVTLDLFKGFDLVLLGDIHKRQILQTRYEDLLDTKRVIYPTVAYPGSLIQQNYGETSTEHGLLEWNLSDFTYKEVDIKNDYGFYTLEVEKGKILNWNENEIPSKVRMRVKYVDTSSEDRSIVEAFIRKKRKVLELSSQVIRNFQENTILSKYTQQLSKIRDVEYQNLLITDYLKDLNLSESQLDAIRHINRVTNSKLSKTSESKILRNTSWIPLKFEFSNMFSYGEDNILDFSTTKGVYGILGPNAIGKSTLFDALCFCLFDKCSKTSKAKYVLNKSKDFFEAKLNLLIGDSIYVIHKRGEKVSYKKNEENVRVIIDFYTYDSDGNKKSLNGDQRDSTTQIIRSYVGTYEDFILTSLSVQNNGTNFIEKPQRERRELLINFLDINVFEELYSTASDYFNMSEVKSRVKLFNKEAITSNLSTAVLELESIEEDISTLSLQVADAKHLFDHHTKEKEELLSQIKQTVSIISEDSLLRNLGIETTKLQSAQDKLLKFQQNNLAIDLQEVTNKITSCNEDELKENFKRFQKLTLDKNKCIQNLEYLDRKIKDLSKHITDLENHEYNPDCEFCITHPTVQIGQESKLQLKKLEEEKNILFKNLEVLKGILKEVSTSGKDLEDLNSLKQKRLELENSLKVNDSQIQVCEKEIQLCEINIEIINNKLKNVQKNKEIENKNIIVKNTIENLDKELKKLKTIIDNLNLKLREKTGVQYSKKAYIDNTNRELQEMQKLIEEHEAYSYYLQAVKLDGVPYKITNEIIPDIEEEINNILLEVVDFKIQLETDNKNINAYIVYSPEKVWPVESGSGMEKFIASLAIRTALITNTSLPKPNFICIDEGFGVLDPENLISMSVIFDKMKLHFDTLFCISHIDSMKDIMDSSTSIELKNSNSFIQCN